MANNDNLKPFKPGQSGNPEGMRPGTRHLSTKLREALTKGVQVEVGKRKVVVNTDELMKQVLKGVAKGSPRFIELVFDRIDGKATQPIEHSGEITTNNFTGKTDAELRAEIADMKAKRKGNKDQ